MLFPLAFASLKTLASLSIATGLGWAFAEVRRFVFHPAAFYAEAMDDRSQGRTFGLISELILGMTVSAGRATSTNYAWGRPFPHAASNDVGIAIAFILLIV